MIITAAIHKQATLDPQPVDIIVLVYYIAFKKVAHDGQKVLLMCHDTSHLCVTWVNNSWQKPDCLPKELVQFFIPAYVLRVSRKQLRCGVATPQTKTFLWWGILLNQALKKETIGWWRSTTSWFQPQKLGSLVMFKPSLSVFSWAKKIKHSSCSYCS